MDVADHGVDISVFQPGFNFDAYQASWLGLKQTEGLTWPDQDDPGAADLLRNFRQRAADLGKACILYHYLRPQPGRTGRDEADHLIRFIGDLRPSEGVMIDDEWEQCPIFGDEHEDFVIAFVDRIEEQWPEMRGKVLYYSYPSYMAKVSTDRIAQRCPLWVAHYGPDDGRADHGPPPLDRWSSAAIWQYSSKGRDPAFDGPLDVNQLFVPLDQVTRASGAQPQPQTVAPPPQPVAPPPPPAHPPWPGVDLSRGSNGPNVVVLQQRLAERGWSVGIDGEFGRQTDTIIRAFQAEKGLASDGVVGPQTWDALWTAPLTEAPPPPPPPPPSAPPPPPAPGNPGQAHPDPVGQIAAWQFYDVAGFQIAFAWWDLVVDGDAGAETAKAVQKVVDEGGRLSPHFSIDEFKCKHCGRIKAHRETLRSLERERELLGRAIVIVSGHRCEEHNRNVGGAPNSQHLFGTAVDKRTPLHTSREAGFSGIGTKGEDCLHGDRRDAGPDNTTGGRPGAPTVWVYG